MDAASSGERAHSAAGDEAATIVAMAVPHDPAPITATRSFMVPRAYGCRSGRPYTGAVRSTAMASLGPEVVLIPVKAFAQAKRRLGGAMGDRERVRLVRAMAGHVVAASTPLPSPSCATTRTWRHGRRASERPWCGRPVRDSTVRCAPESPALADTGTKWVTVAHGDLPRARGLGTLEHFAGVTLVPDRRDDGTNVLRLPARHEFHFAYGPSSFRAHRAEAVRLGLPVRVLRVPDLAYDVDWPDDVAELARR